MTNDQDKWNKRIIDEFRANRGNVATNGFGKSLILLHHIGARTGTPRVNPLRTVHDGNDTWWIVASNQGAPRHPQWYFNLRMHPDSEIETPDDGRYLTYAEILNGDDRTQARQRFTAAHPIFLQYQEEVERMFPVVALRRPD